MIIAFENRKDINNKELSAFDHDACFYSFETTYANGKYRYDFRASCIGQVNWNNEVVHLGRIIYNNKIELRRTQNEQTI